MRINICSNITNGIGLEVEYKLLSSFLSERGHTVRGIQWTDPIEGQPEADLQIWLEVVVPKLLPLAPEHWLFVNPEWLRNGEALNEIRKPHFTKVLCKTRDAFEIMNELTDKAVYVGFLTRDHKRDIPRKREFLHVGGNGGHRNTQAVIEAWSMYQYYDVFPGNLTVVSNKYNDRIENVTFLPRVSDEELIRLQNSHLFHLYPSAYEGFGHALHESLGVGAITMTTDAPPMNEFGCPFLVPSVQASNHGQALIHDVNPMDIRSTAKKMFHLSEEESDRFSLDARARFEKSNEEFTQLFGKELESLEQRPAAVPVTSAPTSAVLIPQKKKLTVAILGNHSVSYCTERELDWSFERLGHRVIQFQENMVTTDNMLALCLEYGVDLFLYVHTHGTSVAGSLSLDDFLTALKRNGIRTASFHLDLYWGLNINDLREDQIGRIPFWHTDYVFTADGGHQREFAERGVNHFWLPPAVVERGCHLGVRQAKFAAEVAFVGSECYHPEYPFRAQLIKFLRQTYGRAFKLFGGDTSVGIVREQDLNDVYASVSVVVGDCCFAGAPLYWSDRVPETLGRGGFLIHPAVTGLRIPGLVTFKPGDLDDLKSKIDYYLGHEDERRELQQKAFKYVREYETYTNRVEEILTTMGLK